MSKSKSQQSSPAADQSAARAPYNFVPLPERAVDFREQPGLEGLSLEAALPSHDTFHPGRYTGYVDVTLTTESPLYIRGPLTQDELEDNSRDRSQHRNKPDFFHHGDPNQPVIPGSSLRGMLRALLEIVNVGENDASKR
ncbi:hypothetical protein HC928_02180 [bacterium]|nr:hypothetical protein [bacterium]